MRRWLDLIDFKCEADNSEKCKIDLQSLNFAYVPDVWREGCSKRILVTEFIDGIKISDTALLKERGYSVTTIDERLIKIMAEQVIQQLNKSFALKQWTNLGFTYFTTNLASRCFIRDLYMLTHIQEIY